MLQINESALLDHVVDLAFKLGNQVLANKEVGQVHTFKVFLLRATSYYSINEVFGLGNLQFTQHFVLNVLVLTEKAFGHILLHQRERSWNKQALGYLTLNLSLFQELVSQIFQLLLINSEGRSQLRESSRSGQSSDYASDLA